MGQQTQKSTKERIRDLILLGPPYLDGERPFLTVADLADQLEVSRETVRNNIEEVAAHPMISTDSVGQADVFWRAYKAEADWEEGLDGKELDDFVDEFIREQQDKLIVSRALWLHEIQTLLDKQSGEITPADRIDAWQVLVGYLKALHLAGGGVSLAAALSHVDLPPRLEDVELSDYAQEGPALPEAFSHLEDVLYEVPLFDDIEGVATLIAHHRWLVEHGNGDLSEDEIDDLAPSVGDLHYTGSVLDRLATQLHGFDW